MGEKGSKFQEICSTCIQQQLRGSTSITLRSEDKGNKVEKVADSLYYSMQSQMSTREDFHDNEQNGESQHMKAFDKQLDEKSMQSKENMQPISSQLTLLFDSAFQNQSQDEIQIYSIDLDSMGEISPQETQKTFNFEDRVCFTVQTLNSQASIKKLPLFHSKCNQAKFECKYSEDKAILSETLQISQQAQQQLKSQRLEIST